MVKTNTQLIETIKRKSYIPADQNTFTDQELLDIANEELQSIVVPEILSTREDYLVRKDTVNLTGQTGQVLDIPSRAVGQQLRELTVTLGNVEHNLARYDIEDRVYDNVGGNIYGFDLTGNQINLKGAMTGILNIYYYLRPGNLTEVKNARQITAIDTGANTITVAALPSTWSTASIFDVVKGKPGFDFKQLSLTVSAIDTGTNTITFNESLNSSGWDALIVGDWLTLEETSPIAQIPTEWQNYLAEAATAFIMESQGDSQGFDKAMMRKEELYKNAVKMISPRVDGQSRRFVPRRNRGAFTFNSLYRNY